MYKYITILGAAGQIAQKLTATLLTYTDMHITLYGRQLKTRIPPEIIDHERVTVIEGSFQNPGKLEQAVTNAEVVFVGAMESGSDMASIVKALSRKNIRRVIGVSMAGLSGEFPVALEKWTFDNLPISYVQGEFNDAQVSREAVVKAIFDILHAADETPFHRTSIGVGEPGTHYDKPSFH
ncbi:MAG: NAD(P)H-binding protein [Veillonella sp.]|nr:NAD(P)H-binding protein [Veillonella sp.]